MAVPPAATAAHGDGDLSGVTAGRPATTSGALGNGAGISRSGFAATLAPRAGSTALAVSGTACAAASVRSCAAGRDGSSVEGADDGRSAGRSANVCAAPVDEGAGRAAGTRRFACALATRGTNGVENAVATNVSPPMPMDITVRIVTIAAARLRDHMGAIDVRDVTILETRARRYEDVSAAGAARMMCERPRSVASLRRHSAYDFGEPA